MVLIAGILGTISSAIGILAVTVFSAFLGSFANAAGADTQGIGVLMGLAGLYLGLRLVASIVLIVMSKWMKDDLKVKKGNIIALVAGVIMIFPTGSWIAGGLAVAGGIWGLISNKQ